MLLGLDWGQKKIGLAIAHREIAIASALSVIKNDRHVFVELNKVIRENDIDLIVVGKSEHLLQSDNERIIKKFGDECSDHLGVFVVFSPEMFSTREAQSNLKSAGKKKVDKIDDAEAARIILQQYLDARSTKM